jgi:hypothetical protein
MNQTQNYLPHTQGYSSCAHRNYQNCLANGCQWISWYKGTSEPTSFCRGLPGSTTPYSMRFYQGVKHQKEEEEKSNIESQLFKPNGRFNLYRWHRQTDAKKNKIFTKKGLLYLQKKGKSLCNHLQGKEKAECQKAMKNLVPKYCRCILETAAADVFRHGEMTHVPYAVCQASLSRSHARPGISPAKIRSLLASTSLAGDCTSTLDVNQVPTSFLYGFAVSHLKTSRGRRTFAGNIPSLEDFLRDREYWRPHLVELFQHYTGEQK